MEREAGLDVLPTPVRGQGPGIVARLKSEGSRRPRRPTLGTNQPFDVASLKGQAGAGRLLGELGRAGEGDAKQVAELAKDYGGKGLAIRHRLLRDNAQTAAQALASLQMPGIHLHQPGARGNPLAVQYGVMGPQAFLIGKDGQRGGGQPRAVQLGAAGDDIEKAAEVIDAGMRKPRVATCGLFVAT